MTSDSTPAFEIEKEALKTEIETGIQAGVDHLEAKTAKRKDADKYHNTRHLLKQYRKVAYAIQISEADMNVRMEMEHGTRLSTLEVNAELAGVDLSGSKLEGYARTVIRSKNMLQIIDNALNTVRMDPDHGELMYQVLYLTYFSKKKPANREVILAELDRQGFPMSMVTYQNEYYVTRNQIAAYESHEIDDICDYLTVHEVLELPYTARSEYVLYRWNDVFDNAEKIRSMVDRLRFQVECFNEALPYEAGQSYGDRAASQVRVIYRIS